jgi:murein DD-endopeptidase MepM/ murein hydrolase activator NlpD
VADGKVKEVFDDAMMGKCVSVEHEGGVVSIYRNLSEELAAGITAGASVSAGDAIGTVGESALCELAEEPHLHFEMTVNGIPTDPLSLLSENSRAASLTEKDEIYEN